MCFEIRDISTNKLLPLKRKGRKARKDIKVFKVIKVKDGKYVSYYYGFEYKEGETYKSDIVITENKFIDDGLHSYNAERLYPVYEEVIKIRYKRTQHIMYMYCATKREIGEKYAVMECTIPKGSLYYENDKGEIVSNVIVVDKISNLH